MSYIGKLFTTGAIRKTPDKVVQAIINEIQIKSDVCLVEFGAGKGEITKSIFQKTNYSVKNFYAFEFDEELGTQLQSISTSINVLYKDAFEFRKWLPADLKVDYFICAIPLSFYSFKKIKLFLFEMEECLSKEGKIIIIFNAIWLTPLLKKIFKSGNIQVFATFPVYFLYKKSK